MVTREKAHAQLLVVSKHCGRPTSLLSDSARWSTFSLSLSLFQHGWIEYQTTPGLNDCTEPPHESYCTHATCLTMFRWPARATLQKKKKTKKTTSFLCFPTAYLRYTQTHTVFVGAVISRSKHNCIQAVHCPL